MPKSYDEQMQDMLATIQKTQRKLAELKRKKAEIDKHKKLKIADAVLIYFPDLLDMMDDENFKITEFVKTENFINAFRQNRDLENLSEWSESFFNEDENEDFFDWGDE